MDLPHIEPGAPGESPWSRGRGYAAPGPKSETPTLTGCDFGQMPTLPVMRTRWRCTPGDTPVHLTGNGVMRASDIEHRKLG